ncbi:MAG: o-succinylbenzoate synthase [Symbiopectobacterium sp.]|uniref:o-succinylbenzoate synthase n=1 Tax=Symbiopectobacterium sp. TaxID=2952789 RepID=UPI0039E9C571
MRIDKIVPRKMKMALKTPFTTSFATQTEKHFTIAEVHSGGVIGYGDCSAISLPFYNEETNVTAWHIMRDFLIPMVKQAGEISHPAEVREIFMPVKRNNCAKAAIEGGIWDAFAKQQGIPLHQAIGGTRDRVEAGVSIGIQSTQQKLVEVVAGYLDEGYRRIKIKIKPGKDIDYIEALRSTFGDITLMADANSAYTLDDIDFFKRLDRFNLLMIEQPLAHDDIVDHRNNAGTFSAQRLIALQGGALNNSGTLSAGERMTLTLDRSLTNRGMVQSGQDLRVQAGHIDNLGTVSAADLHLKADALRNQANVQATHDAEIVVTDALTQTRDGTLFAGDRLTLDASAEDTQGDIQAQQFAMKAQRWLQQGSVSIHGDGDIQVADWNNQGQMVLGGNGVLSGTSFNNSGSWQSATLAWQGGALVNQGRIQSLGALGITREQ